MKKYLYALIGINLIILMSSCSSSKPANPNFINGATSAGAAVDESNTPSGNGTNLVTYGRDSLASGEIKMPANYNKDDYRELLLAVSFQDVAAKTGDISPEISQTLSSRLQTEMAKLKRFRVYSIHNRQGVAVLQSLSDVGEAKMKQPVDMKEIDLMLTGSITISKEKQERRNDDLIIYEVECDFNCEDLKTHEVKFAEKAKGQTSRIQKLSLTGKQLAGYNEDDERQAIYGAAMQALAKVANKLGNTYPVGGTITAMRKDRLTLDKGFENGVGGNMQMVVYTTQGGVDVPVAVAEATPGKDTSSLKIWRWNDEEKELCQGMQSDKDWLKNNKLYAVGYGMAIPPEWENDYKDNYAAREGK